MKRANNLIQAISDPDNLRWAFLKAKKGKSNTAQVEAFRQDLDTNLLELQKQILQGPLEVGAYTYFKIFDPKEREICASTFRENVLHHAIMNICHDHFERKQIFDSYASRKGKGTYAAVERAQHFTRKYSWFLKLDVRKFFDSIHHEVVKAQLRRMFKDSRLLEILDQIIDSYESSPLRGVPIGNLTSQYFANHYLAGLDHYIKEVLQIKAYVRYMDDMVLWHNEKAVLKEAHEAICAFVENNLRCELKPEVLRKTKLGLPFLGYMIHPHHIRLTARSKRRFLQKMKKLMEKHQSGEWSESECQRRAQSLLAFTQHADSHFLRKKLLSYTDTTDTQ